MKRLVLGVAMLALVGCSGGGGSNSGGNSSATLKDCQVCTGDYQCESGWCMGPYKTTGYYRCTPKGVNLSTWVCPTKYTKLLSGSTGEGESCQ